MWVKIKYVYYIFFDKFLGFSSFQHFFNAGNIEACNRL